MKNKMVRFSMEECWPTFWPPNLANTIELEAQVAMPISHSSQDSPPISIGCCVGFQRDCGLSGFVLFSTVWLLFENQPSEFLYVTLVGKDDLKKFSPQVVSSWIYPHMPFFGLINFSHHVPSSFIITELKRYSITTNIYFIVNTCPYSNREFI